MKQVWRELRPLLAYMGLFSFCVNLLYLIPALFMLQVFDRVLTTHSGETLVVLLVGTAVAMVVMLLLDYVRQRLQGVLAAIADERLARPLVESLVERAARTPMPPSAKACATWRHSRLSCPRTRWRRCSTRPGRPCSCC